MVLVCPYSPSRLIIRKERQKGRDRCPRTRACHQIAVKVHLWTDYTFIVYFAERSVSGSGYGQKKTQVEPEDEDSHRTTKL